MRALVLGSAECLFADIDGALALFAPDLVVACNDAGVAWPGKLDHWATLHPDKLPAWIARRRAKGRRDAGALWTYGAGTAPSGLTINRVAEKDGSSALLCVRVARLSGATRIVCCGTPLAPGPHIEGVSADEWAGWRKRGRLLQPRFADYQAVWLADKGRLDRDTRSMSGWTAELLGKPDRTWLDG